MISFVIPFRPSTQERKDLCDFVVARYSGYWPDAEIVLSDTDSEEFSRSGAINRGVEKASGDMLVISDADTICNRAALEKATTMSALTSRWVLPYATMGYYNLTEGFTSQVLRRKPTMKVSPDDYGFAYDHNIESWSGLLVMPRAAFDAVNGFDERFQGWGYEDNSFRLAMDTIWGPYLRVEDENVYHLYHSVPADGAFNSPNLQFNRDRYYKLYSKARSKDAMLKLVEGNR